ncbi:MAG TPA: LysM domain-containing protein [Rhizobacter sp.]|nr:LysM domain-containing protein [Rhizobacter sp.]
MTRRNRFALTLSRATALSLTLGACLVAQAQSAANLPITAGQRSTAQRIAAAGVPLSDLAANAPDAYTVKSGDTLWDISKMYLTSPWRWPELWGMNMDEIRNPHLIYPGQVLVLDKTDGRARLRVGQGIGDAGASGRLSPRVRSSDVLNGIPSISLNAIEPFLNEAVIFDENELARAPRVVAAQEGRVLLSRGDLAYVRGDLAANRNFRVFREPQPLLDPSTREVLGYEAKYLGIAEYTRRGGTSDTGDVIPDTFTLTSVRQEILTGDRLSPVPARQFINYVPHAPQAALSGQIASIYGDSDVAGQNQIVALNRGSRDGVETGHVLALWRKGEHVVDRTNAGRETIQLPDERHGALFVFRVFNRMSYALVLSVQEPVRPGDRFTQP